MSKPKELKSTYINYYVDGSDEAFGIRLATLNGKDSKIFYKTDYNSYIPNAINYIIGLLGHFGNKSSRPEQYVFVSNKLLARYIGISYSHASVIMDQLQEIFKLKVIMQRGRGQSRRVSISKELIEFMKVFNETQLEEYMITNNIDHKYRFALQQVYRYLGWGITPGQLSTEERKQRIEYLRDPERKNFLHYAYTSNQKPSARIDYLKKHQDKLSEVQKRQLDTISEVHVPGTKLIHYWFKVLIKLQQIVSYIVESAKKKNKSNEKQPIASANNEKTSIGDSVAHASATQVAQKKPEDPAAAKLQFMGKVITSWNKRAEHLNIPHVARLSEERYNSLLAITEDFTEREILSALHKLEYLHTGDDYDHKMDFNRFIESETIVYLLEYNSHSDKAEELGMLEDTARRINVSNSIQLVPEFDSLKDLNLWLKEQN